MKTQYLRMFLHARNALADVMGENVELVMGYEVGHKLLFSG